MKILVDCTPLGAGGGVQVAVAFLNRLLQEKTVSFVLVVPGHLSQTFEAIGVPREQLVVLRKAGVLDFLRISTRLRRLERRLRPDVVFTVFGPAFFKASAPHLVGFALPNMIYKADGPLVQYVTRTRVLSDRIRAHLLRKADHFVVETETVRQRLALRISRAESDITVIGNAVNPLLLKYEPRPRPEQQVFSLLVPSAFYPHKNLAIIPAVAEELSRLAPQLNFEFQLTLAASSSEWQSIDREVNHRDMSGKVTTLGPLSLDHLAQAYGMCSAVFLPTLREASSAVYPESFYFERPLLTSDLDFARELCADGADYFPPLDAKAIAAVVLRLANDVSRQQDLIRRGKAVLQNNYPTTAEKFRLQLRLLQQVANRNSENLHYSRHKSILG